MRDATTRARVPPAPPTTCFPKARIFTQHHRNKEVNYGFNRYQLLGRTRRKKKASENDALEQVSRTNEAIPEFCVIVSDLAKKLGSGRSLLDIGAGNGLIDCLLAPWFNQILAIEAAPSTYDLLCKNTQYSPEISCRNAMAQNASLDKKEFSFNDSEKV